MRAETREKGKIENFRSRNMKKLLIITCSLAQLKRIGRETGAGNWTRSAHYVLMKNITLANNSGQSNWTPIGGVE